nr:hypothetical protein [Tanacetum cinerariifolium]
MDLVFHTSGCAVENQVKFATCTMLDAALTWWNGHVRTLGHEDAYVMTWETFKKRLTKKYYPKGEIKKLEIELWNLKTEKVDKYISGLPDNIYGNVMSPRPKTLDFAIELANDLMDQKLRTYAERQGQERRNRTEDLNLYALSATITIMESVHQSASTTRKSDCSVLKNQGIEARGMVYALGGGETNQDLDNTEDDITA